MRNFLPYLNGFIKIRIHGGQTERFLNLCMSRGIILWDLSGASDGSYSCFLSTRHFFFWHLHEEKQRYGSIFWKNMDCLSFCQ